LATSRSYPTRRQPRLKKRHWLIIPLVNVGAIYGLVQMISAPAVGSVSPSPPAIKQPAVAATKHFAGNYLSFDYPGSYSPVYSAPSGQFLEVCNLAGRINWLSVAVLREALVNDSGLVYRHLHPERYREIADSADQVTFVSTSPPIERTVFIAHQGLVASLDSLSSSDQAAASDSQTILRSLSWR